MAHVYQAARNWTWRNPSQFLQVQTVQGSDPQQGGRYSHRNTDKDVREFLSRHSLASDGSLFGESDSEEEFDDYLVPTMGGQNDHKDNGQDESDGGDGEDGEDSDDERGREEEMAIDIAKEDKGVGATTVSLDGCRLPKRLSLNALEA